MNATITTTRGNIVIENGNGVVVVDKFRIYIKINASELRQVEHSDFRAGESVPLIGCLFGSEVIAEIRKYINANGRKSLAMQPPDWRKVGF